MHPARLTVLPFALLLIALPTLAAAGPWYFGASAGSSSYDSAFLAGSTGTASGYDLIGGYRLSRHWSLEADYFDLGSADVSNTFFGVDVDTESRTSVDTDGFALSMVGTLPFGDIWSGFATFGAADTRTKLTTATSSSSPVFGTKSTSVSESASKVVLDYGVGVQADTGGAWAFRLGWRRLNNVGKTDSTGTGDVDFVFLSAPYSF